MISVETVAERVSFLLAREEPAVQKPVLRFFSKDVAADGLPGGVYALPDYKRLAVAACVPAEQEYGTAIRITRDVLRWYQPFKLGMPYAFKSLWTLAPCAQRDLLPGEKMFPPDLYLEASGGRDLLRIHNGPCRGVIHFNRRVFDDMQMVRHVPLTSWHTFVYSK